MAKPWAEAFYKSRAWRNCRDAYVKSIGGLCERCLTKGLYVPVDIVHHKTYITPENINNPNITLSFDNLEGVCRNCHAEEHNKRTRRYKVDEYGRVITSPQGY